MVFSVIFPNKKMYTNYKANYTAATFKKLDLKLRLLTKKIIRILFNYIEKKVIYYII